jgi:hypothetical protein
MNPMTATRHSGGQSSNAAKIRAFKAQKVVRISSSEGRGAPSNSSQRRSIGFLASK